MWECPDFFALDGKHVLLCSPQDMLPEGIEYHNGNGTLCLIGDLDESSKRFSFHHNQTVDYGIEGRTVDLEITIRPKDGEKLYHTFGIWFAQNEKCRTSLSYRP